MKKQRIIGIVLLVVAGLLIAGTGIVYAGTLAHSRTPFNPYYDRSNSDNDYVPMRGFGMRTDEDGTFPPMMTAMIEAVSEKTGLSVDEIQAKLGDGERLYTIATDAGMSAEDFDALMDETHDSYMEQYQDQFGSSDHYQLDDGSHGRGMGRTRPRTWNPQLWQFARFQRAWHALWWLLVIGRLKFLQGVVQQ